MAMPLTSGIGTGVNEPSWVEEEARYEQLAEEYRAMVTHDLLKNVEEFLQFSSVRQLFKVIADSL